MKTLSINVYEFDELNGPAKEKAREWFREFALDYDWWDCTYEDAKTIGLEIEEFDIYRRNIDGKLTQSVGATAKAILENHGPSCATYKLAKDYYRRKHTKDHPYTDEDFKHALLREYLVLLDRECEWLLSDECVDENIRGNEYTFTEDGTREG